MKLIKYPSTPHFKQVVTTIKTQVAYQGKNEQGEPIYDYLKPMPAIKFKSTVKLHGTHADIVYNKIDGLYLQTRNGVLDLEKDMGKHFGFVQYIASKKDDFIKIIKEIGEEFKLDFENDTITLCGEWAGGNIQKNVALTQLPKSFFIFRIKVSNESNSYWVNIERLKFNIENTYNIYDFPTQQISIDFNNPKLAINELESLTEKVGDECPVAKQLGVEGIGEGLVWTGSYQDNIYIFKTKDSRHAGKSKVKTLTKQDNELLQKISDVAEEITPTWRLNQMFNEITDNGSNVDRKLIGTFIKSVMNDIIKEEMETINNNNLELKQLGGKISQISKKYFFQMENESL